MADRELVMQPGKNPAAPWSPVYPAKNVDRSRRSSAMGRR